MSKRSVVLTLLPLSLAVAACSGTLADPGGDPESACEHGSPLQDVESYDGSAGVTPAFVARHRRAVGLLYWKNDLAVRYREQAGNVSGEGWCTGTLIDEDLFLTAGHCLDNIDTGSWRLPKEKGGIPLSSSDLAREFKVAFRYEAPAEPALAAPVEDVEVVRLEEHRNGGVDYAILRLASAPGLRHGVARLSPVDSARQSRIVILQHPAADRMKIGGGAVVAIAAGKLSYWIDTRGGSSGAGILDASSGKLVGIHTSGGCTKRGAGSNSGVTIGALAQVSKTVRGLLDTSRDYLVGDFDGNGSSDLAVFFRGCLYPDTDRDGVPDQALIECAPDPDADEYFVGHWVAGSSGLGWRRGGCVYLDTNPTKPLCLASDSQFQLLVADWDADGRSDLGVLRGNCLEFDTNLDGTLDTRGYCYGNGLGEDQYLVGRWTRHRDGLAVREGYTLLIDSDHDGITDQTRQFGRGGEEDQYLAFDSSGDGQDEVAFRNRATCFVNRGDASNPDAYETRSIDDFWSQY